MNILINAANVRFGGGVTVAKNIINSLIRESGNHYTLLLPRNAGYNFEESNKLKIIYIENKFHFNLLYKIRFVRWGFGKLVKELKSDFVFSLGNVAFPCKVPHLVLIQNAYLFYPESELWKRLPFKFKWYIKMANVQTAFYLRYANGFFVQTEVMKDRLCRLFGINALKVHILPNVVSYQSKAEFNTSEIGKTYDSIKLLFLSKYYPHKNFEILLPLARRIKARGSSVSISVTVSPEEHPYLTNLQQQLEREELTDIIRMIGAVKPEEINEVFKNHDGTFLPSLLESFSGTYIESMFYGKPVFTSHLDFAQVVCKEAAFYFNPLDADNILDKIITAYNDPILIKDKVQKGHMIIEHLPNWQDIHGIIYHTISEVKAQFKD